MDGAAIAFHENPRTLPAMERPKILQEHHIIYIEARTKFNRLLTNKELANELKGFYPDISQTKLNASTVGRAQKTLNFHFLLMREIVL